MDWKALAQVLKEGCWQVMPTYRGAASPRVGQGLTEGLWHCQSTGLCVLASPVTALGVTCRARGLGLARSVSTLIPREPGIVVLSCPPQALVLLCQLIWFRPTALLPPAPPSVPACSGEQGDEYGQHLQCPAQETTWPPAAAPYKPQHRLGVCN